VATVIAGKPDRDSSRGRANAPITLLSYFVFAPTRLPLGLAYFAGNQQPFHDADNDLLENTSRVPYGSKPPNTPAVDSADGNAASGLLHPEDGSDKADRVVPTASGVPRPASGTIHDDGCSWIGW